MPLAAEYSFTDFCQLLTRLSMKKGREKREELRRFFAAWRSKASDDPAIDTVYPVMRLLLPMLDTERNSYGLKETKLRDIYMDMLGIGKNSVSEAADRLKNWKMTGGKLAGDLGRAIEFACTDRVPKSTHPRPVSIAEVNAQLDKLAKCASSSWRGAGAGPQSAGGAGAASQDSPSKSKGESQRKQRLDALRVFRENCSPVEHFWLVRIILCDLKIGVKEPQVWDAFHEQAAEYWGRCTNIRKLCHDLHLASRRPLEHVQAGEACGVMLAAMADDVSKHIRGFRGEEFIMEVKYDGERIHLHKNGNDLKYFSRNNKDFTGSYNTDDPARSHGLNVAPALRRVRSCILDGEMMGYNLDLKEFVSKGESIDIKAFGRDGQRNGMTDQHPSVVQCYVVFDLLLLNGEPLYDRPLVERKRLLKEHIPEVPGRLYHAPWQHRFPMSYQPGTTLDQFHQFAQLCVDEAHEGVIIKKPMSTYALGRRVKDWLKWKPEYLKEISGTFDVLIVGGSFGEGRRGGGLLSHFLCAVAEPPPLDAPPGTKPTRFLTFTKLGSGYSMEKLREKNRQLRPHMRKVDTSRDDWPCGMGPNIMLAMPGYKEKPDVWIEPEKSILVEVQAAQITRSEKFAVGYTLRFPRVRRFREDKEWWQCDTTYNVIETAGAATGGNLASGTIEAHHFDVEQKQRKKGGVAASRATVPLTLKKIDVSHIQKKSKIFKDMHFVVDLQTEEAKRLIVEQIVEHGGRETLYPAGISTIIIANKLTARNRLHISAGLNIVKPSWIQACVRLHRIVDFTPQYMLHANRETEEKMREEADEFGDPYRRACTVDSFKEMRERVFSEDGSKVKLLSADELGDIESNCLALRPFRGMRAYFDVNSVPTDSSTATVNLSLELLLLEFELEGGEVAGQLDEACTHVIVADDMRDRVASIFDVIYDWRRRPKVVWQSWVADSLEVKAPLSERNFMLHVPENVRAAHLSRR